MSHRLFRPLRQGGQGVRWRYPENYTRPLVAAKHSAFPPPLHHASSQSDNSKLRNPRAPRADFQRCFPDSDFFPDSGPPGLELPPWSHCANFPAADPVQKNLPMLPAWLQLELPVYFPRSQAAWARENGAKVAESRAQPRFDVRYGSRDRERGVKFRSSNSGGGGHSGLIHWMTSAHPALSASCCR